MTDRPSDRAIAQAFEIELAKLLPGAQQNIRDAMARGESLSWEMFRAGWLAAAPEGAQPSLFRHLVAIGGGRYAWTDWYDIERFTDEESSQPLGLCNVQYAYTTPPQPTEAARDREDAERYRWLRDRALNFERESSGHGTPWCVIGMDLGDAEPLYGTSLDSVMDECMVIDAARAAGGGGSHA